MMDAIRTIESGCITDFLHTFGFSRYVALAEATLPLLRLDSREVKDGGSLGKRLTALGNLRCRAVNCTVSCRIAGSDRYSRFLAPVLKQEISKLARPLLGKPI